MLTSVLQAQLSGEGLQEGLPKVVANLALTAGVALVKHAVEVYLVGHFQQPLMADESLALKKGANPFQYHHQRATLDDPVYLVLNEKTIPKIVFPVSLTTSPTPTQTHEAQAALGGLLGVTTCATLAVVGASLVLQNSGQHEVPGNPSSSTGSNGSSAMPSGSNTSSPARQDGSGGSGGNRRPPSRNLATGSASSKVERPESPRNYSTAQGDSPPPPPPPPFASPVEGNDDADKHPTVTNNWFSLTALISLIGYYLVRRKLLRILKATKKQFPPMPIHASPLDGRKDVALALATQDSLKPKNRAMEGNCPNVMPLRATRAAVPAISARIGVPTSQSGLPLKSDFPKNPGPKAVHASVSGPTLKFFHVIEFMVFAFCPALLLPLVVFWLAGYHFEDNFLSAVFYDDQTTFTTTNDEEFTESSINKVAKDDVASDSEDEESFVYPASEVPLNEVVEVTDPETDDEVFVYERMKEDLQRSSSTTDSCINGTANALAPLKTRGLNPMAKTFYPEQPVPKKPKRAQAPLRRVPSFCSSLFEPPKRKTFPIQFDPPMPTDHAIPIVRPYRQRRRENRLPAGKVTRSLPSSDLSSSE
ncbi:hypothetical protein BDZ97DRAFT_95612 [Flammula alnicola]|nr:hypothetical protein BDZ97DRAFT_95612 [Flammula alnicola]